MAKKEVEEINYVVRIAGADLNGRKPVLLALQKVKGVGSFMSNAVLTQLGYDKRKLVGTFSDADISKIEESLKHPEKLGIPSYMLNRQKDPLTGDDRHVVGIDLKVEQRGDIEFLKKIKANRGVRHGKGLKVRGQRTKSTGRTGTTMGVSRKKAAPSSKKKEGGAKK